MGGQDVADAVLGIVGGEGSVEVVGEQEDMRHAAGEQLDGAMDFKNRIVVDHGAFRAVFLVGWLG